MMKLIVVYENSWFLYVIWSCWNLLFSDDLVVMCVLAI